MGVHVLDVELFILKGNIQSFKHLNFTKNIVVIVFLLTLFLFSLRTFPL